MDDCELEIDECELCPVCGSLYCENQQHSEERFAAWRAKLEEYLKHRKKVTGPIEFEVGP